MKKKQDTQINSAFFCFIFKKATLLFFQNSRKNRILAADF